jgi:hypothetical protein
MPFLMLYVDRKVLNGLGYVSSCDELDAYTATCLIAIESELKKQENDELEKQRKSKGAKRGRK